MTRLVDFNRKGVVIPWVAMILVILVGMAALTIDVGRLCFAAQRAQDGADAAAMAGGSALPDYTEAESLVLDMADSNNEESPQGYQVVCSSADIEFWGPGETVPNFGLLGPAAWATRVTVHVPMEYAFAKVLGLNETTITRSCTVVRMPAVGEVSVAPMWLDYRTDYQYGQQYNLLMADGPHYDDIPGSFGFLVPPSGDPNTFVELLRGYDLTHEQIASNRVNIGDVEEALPGSRVGQWRKAIEALEVSHSDGLARLQRATWDPWGGDTFGDFHTNNPRFLIVPRCEYLGGDGANARFKVHGFQIFWLEGVDSQGQPKSIIGRCVQYDIGGAQGDPLAPANGLWTLKMAR